MKIYLKRNIHHPVIEVDGTSLKWEKYAFAQGILKTEDPKVIEVLDAIAKGSTAVQELTEAQFNALVDAQKKTTQATQNRKSFPVQRPAVDVGRSARSAKRSEQPLPESPVPAAEPAAPKAKGRPVISVPVIQPPPGITGQLEDAAPEIP